MLKIIQFAGFLRALLNKLKGLNMKFAMTLAISLWPQQPPKHRQG